MSIEQKIAELLAESKNAEEVILENDQELEEVVLEEVEELEEEELKPSYDSEEPNVKKNNVGNQKVGGKSKTSNKVYDGASASESSHIDKLKSDGVTNVEGDNPDNARNLSTFKEESFIDVSEDVEALTNGEDLSEEFKTKAATIFEAAVVNRVKSEVSRLEEEFDARLEEAVAQTQEALVEKVDGYLNYVVEQWFAENELALERGMKSEILESFVAGMKGLFEEHYIDVPEEKYDLIGEMEETIQDLNDKLNEQFEANIEIRKQLDESVRKDIVEALCEDLTETDKEKFSNLVEELSFEDSETFEKKAQIIRENYFTTKAPTKVMSSVVTDEPVALTEEKVVAPQMKRYMQALNTLK